MKTLKRTVALLLALSMLFALAPLSVWAETFESPEERDPNAAGSPAIPDPENDVPAPAAAPAVTPAEEIPAADPEPVSAAPAGEPNYAPLPPAEERLATSGVCGDNLTWSLNTSTGTLAISGTGAMKDYWIGNGNRNTAPWASHWIKSVTIENRVTSIGKYAFYNCTDLTSISIGNGVKTIGWGAFSGCSGLTSVAIGNGVTSIGGSAFSGCTNLKYNSFDNGLYLGNTAKPYLVLMNASSNSITSFMIHPNARVIYDSAFRDCSGLTSITIPDSVTSIGSSAFKGCTGMTSVTIPDSVTSIGTSAFDGCSIQKLMIAEGSQTVTFAMVVSKSTLQEVIIPDSVTSFGTGAFDGCKSLTSITIPNSVTSIGNSAFYKCSGLTSVTIPDSVTSIDVGAFHGCSGLTFIIIPDSVTSIGRSAFSYCSGLTSVTIPDSVTSIGDYAFQNCSGLTSVTIPDSVTSIGSSAFSGCTSLQYHSFDNGLYLGNAANPYLALIKASSAYITSSTIHSNTKLLCGSAFSDCTYLASVTIPDSVTSIGYEAFYGCTGLKTVYYVGAFDRWDRISIGTGNDVLKNAKRYGIFLSVDKEKVLRGDSITATVKLDPNPGFRSLSFAPEAGTGLSLLSRTGRPQNGTVAESMSVGSGYTFTPSKDYTTKTGVLVTFTVKVKEDALPGYTAIALDPVMLVRSDGSVAEVPLSTKLFIDVPAEKIALDQTELTINTAEPGALHASLDPADSTLGYVWESSDTSILQIAGEGADAILTGVAPGTATVTVTASSGVSARCNVTVEKVPVTALTLSETDLTLDLHASTATLTATLAPDKPTYPAVTWDSSDPSVVSVSADGAIATLTAKALGTATITAAADGVSASCIVTVSPIPVTNIKLNKEELTLSLQSPSGALSASVVPSYATDPSLVWESSDPSVVAVSGTGSTVTLTGGKLGQAIITVTGSNGQSARCTVEMICRHVHTSHYDRIDPTCDEEGWEAFTYCSDCNQIIEGKDEAIPACHAWGEATYVWSEDNTACTATRTCSLDPTHIETETVTTTSQVKQIASCTDPEITTYTAAFQNEAFTTQNKDVETADAPGHAWGEVSYVWSADFATCTATRVCGTDPTHIDTETATATAQVKQSASCTNPEITTYTVSFTKEVFSAQTKDVETKPVIADSHAWGKVTYTWSKDNTACTATRTCANDLTHVETETVNASVQGNQAPSCTEPGVATHTAAFENKAFAAQTQTVTVPATGHRHTVLRNAVEATVTANGYTGDLYCADCNALLKRGEVIPMTGTIMVESKTVNPGKTFNLTVSIANNPDVMSMLLTPVIPDGLTLVKVEGGAILPDLTTGINILLTADENVTENGVLLTLTLSVDEGASLGDYEVGFLFLEAVNQAEEDVTFTVLPGTVTVVDFLWGDANGDGVISSKDIVRLKNYFANYNDSTGASTVEIFPGADANGDGVISSKDIVRLKNYLANYDNETGLSTVILGPAA